MCISHSTFCFLSPPFSIFQSHAHPYGPPDNRSDHLHFTDYLSYGGIFLVGLIILGNSPRTALKETHDVLNRVVGKSTATSKTVKWIKMQVFRSKKNGVPMLDSKLLLFALLLLVLFGLFVSLSDIGFLGLKACNVPYPSFVTFPASIQTEDDARALVGNTLLNGTNPALVEFHQCDLAGDVFIDTLNLVERLCSQWHNTTYADPSLFRSLNLTDSDVLMHKNLATLNSTASSGFDLNVYYLGASDRVVPDPTISDGIAVLPHETGVRMVVGAPTLSKNQTVDIPKTMAVEIEVGCLPLGLVGTSDVASFSAAYDWFIPDAIYKPTQRSDFAGPDYLFAPLQTIVDEVRDLVQPSYNTSIVDDNGYIRRTNESVEVFGWQSEVDYWYPYTVIVNGSTLPPSIPNLDNCTSQVFKAINASIPSDPVNQYPTACGFYQMRGSMTQEGVMYQVYSLMACASATAFSMVSATLEMDSDGGVSGRLSRLPSDLNIVRANNFNLYQWANEGQFQRYTLSDNPSGDLRHYVYQHYDPYDSNVGQSSLARGPGSPGYALSQVGGAMVSVSSTDGVAVASVFLINSTFFSWDQFNASTVTKWASGYGASYILSSLSMNGFAALDKSQLTIQSTGGRAAVCYMTPYLAAFVPLLTIALFVMLWSLQMLVSSKLHGTKKWEKLYGGLGPSASLSDAKPLDLILTWVDGNSHISNLWTLLSMLSCRLGDSYVFEQRGYRLMLHFSIFWA